MTRGTFSEKDRLEKEDIWHFSTQTLFALPNRVCLFCGRSSRLSHRINLQLLMDVPLQISVEIGSTKKKIKDILEFSQGTIIELERQAGAPVDVMVNGNLIARGDVVVIDDNFAVRITEIVKSKFMDSLGKGE